MKRTERLGFWMIGATLLVIGIVTALLLHDQRATRRAQARSHGVSLARLLATIPYDQLLAQHTRFGFLQALQLNNPDLAYAVVVGPGGEPVAELAQPSNIVPPLRMGGSLWLREERVPPAGDHPAYRDFSAPLFTRGEHVGYVRVGFREAGYSLGPEHTRLFGVVALAVFLLMPLFYFALVREVRPLAQANAHIQECLRQGRIERVEISAAGELRHFIERFNAMMQLAQARLDDAEEDRARAFTSSKVISYQKARVEAVLQALPDAVLVLDDSGVVTFANAKIQPLLGVDAAEVLGRKPSQWCSEEELSGFLARYEDAAVVPCRSEVLEFSPFGCPERRLSAAVYPLFSPKDPSYVFGSLLVCRDATPEALARGARSEFVAHLAHELKSPLNVLGMYAETLIGPDGDSKEFRVEAANVITDEVERLSSLVKNLLDLTKIELGSLAPERQRVKLTDLIADVFETSRRDRRGKDLEFRLELPPSLTAVSLDKELFRVALSNLLTNAIKYNRPGGSVCVSAEEDDYEIAIRVRDSGLGIAPEDQSRIFEKFFRSGSEEVQARPGSGLGLSLTKQIVDLHHGRLEVQSTPGQGTEFSIHLEKSLGLIQRAI
ncbi:MAG: PAS domain-containing protein [Deltaproteobacteria bacterium]|nr:PAS domain-containing protein [Deltaproteobacteria bacterium]